ncbi:hypothetical protein [Ferrimonas marina]|uniref:Uncharacterized protein n=1 Tax=Ferrimonas marina TaxID=299255 RepID=A0A1M5X188_9GAMM|nr:hypothetical protein [Ferrimonas marina]SHH93619.1 hypothetical protein SAMN02745129_3145 [Ferrimonas marina]
MYKQLATAVGLALLVSACSSSSDDDPAPGLPIDQADSVVLEVTGFDASSHEVTFTLADDSGEPLTGAGDNYLLAFLGFSDQVISAYNMGWHHSEQFGCGEFVPQCLGELVSEEPGQYRFVPDVTPEWDESINQLKLMIHVAGERAASDWQTITL